MAYAGPPSFNLRKDLASRSAVVGSVKHGEKLDVLETRRRFVRVRTEQGIEGWTDSSALLSPEQMEDLHKLAEDAKKLPSEGVATAFDTLNIHADPNRQSPSFFQLAESAPVEVIGHQIAPRVAPPPAPAAVHRTVTAKKGPSKGKDSKRIVVPAPAPPAPPKDWPDLSRPRAADLPGYHAPDPPKVPIDDWTLVRTRDGNAGWVLSRMLMMAIPDEVAQYAEGHRITAYLPLGDVKDKEKNETKPNWLWTTISSGQFPYEFDSFRVFVWSTRHHRYETAYIERNVKGHYPVTTEDRPGEDGKAFSLVLEEKDGSLARRTYAFTGFRVRMVSKTPYQAPPPLLVAHAARNFDPLPAAPKADTWKDKLRGLQKKLFK